MGVTAAALTRFQGTQVVPRPPQKIDPVALPILHVLPGSIFAGMAWEARDMHCRDRGWTPPRWYQWGVLFVSDPVFVLWYVDHSEPQITLHHHGVRHGKKRKGRREEGKISTSTLTSRLWNRQKKVSVAAVIVGLVSSPVVAGDVHTFSLSSAAQTPARGAGRPTVNFIFVVTSSESLAQLLLQYSPYDLYLICYATLPVCIRPHKSLPTLTQTNFAKHRYKQRCSAFHVTGLLLYSGARDKK